MLDRCQAVLAEGLASPRAQRLLRLLIVVLSAFLLLLFLYAAVRRMRYPFEVEWIESGMLVSVLRIVHGQALYVRPTLDFVPYLYAPLYLYVVAAVTKLTGIGSHGYAALRLVSTLSTLGCCGAIMALVRTETRRWLPAVAAAGMYVGSYSVLDSFFDIGRVDSLFVCLLVFALLLQRRGHPVVAALMWVLVFQTKQTVLPLAVFILAAEWQRPKRAIAAIATFLVATGASVLLLNRATHGWYSFYVFLVARGLALLPRQAALYWPQVVLEPAAVAWVVVAAALVLVGVRLRSRVTMFYLFVSVALYGGVWFVEAHRGASRNSVMPVYAWTAVLFGVSLARLLGWAEAARLELPQRQGMASVLILGAAVLQLMALIYNPGQYVPPTAAVVALNKMIAEIHAIPGDVYVSYHSYDAVMAGKQPHAETEALGAVIDAHTQVSAGLKDDVAAALAAHRYAAFVTDSRDPGDPPISGYPLAISAPAMGSRYLTSQPQWFLLPCESAPATQIIFDSPGTLTNKASCGTK